MHFFCLQLDLELLLLSYEMAKLNENLAKTNNKKLHIVKKKMYPRLSALNNFFFKSALC